MSEPCQHPYIAIQPDLLADGVGGRPIALCLNPDCQLHAMAMRIVDREFVEIVAITAKREWQRFQDAKKESHD